MYSQCPECLTIYKLGATELSQGHGSVRCGHCAAVFDALRTLTDQLPPEPINHLDEIASDGTLPQLTVPALRPTATKQQGTLFDPDDRLGRSDKPATRNVPPRVQTPAFARIRHIAPIQRNWPWRLGVCVLLLSLVAQISYAERTVLLDDARTRPLLDRACDKPRLPIAAASRSGDAATSVARYPAASIRCECADHFRDAAQRREFSRRRFRRLKSHCRIWTKTVSRCVALRRRNISATAAPSPTGWLPAARPRSFSR